ncbi:Pyridoxine biosynthesis protein [Bifidobacterium longum]|nr:Pyridoxine biosynthesis protein [Bifidobacterium longum]
MTQNRAELNRNLAQMLKGGVIMDVTRPSRRRSLRTLVPAR